MRSPGHNQILKQLSAEDRETLIADADYVSHRVGETFARVGDPISTVYFPDTGVITVISEMATGHHVAVAGVGAEGMLGLGALFGKQRHPLSLIVLVESSGHVVTPRRLTDGFRRSENFRRVMLSHIDGLMRELRTAAACNRVHSHRQRLARWLLTTTDKAGERSLPMTHETLAQLVGGPRHAVTVALNELRRKGAIAHLRGRIDILDRAVLIAQSCECYAASAQSGSP